jgi:hypothetical protein
LGESAEQDEILNQEQPASKKEILAGLLLELDALNISMAQAGLSINYNPGTLRNEKWSDNPSQNVIDSLSKYIVFEKQIRAYFKKLNSGTTEGLRDDFIVNEDEGKYEAKQREETLSIAKEHYALFKAFVEVEIEKEANGDEQLKKEKLTRIEQAAARHLLTPIKHKPSKNTIYAKGRKSKSKEKDSDQPGPPEDPPL